MLDSSVIIWGAGGHGRVVADIVERQQIYKMLGFVDDEEDLWGRRVDGYPVLGQVLDYRQVGFSSSQLILAIGSNEVRHQLAESVETAGLKFATAIHPSAQIGRDVVIGSGTVVMANAVINTGARIGDHVIINTGATVDHDCVIEDFVHVAPGAHLAGNVTVGSGAFVGIGCCAIPGVKIGRWSVIGAGSTVIRDISDYVTAVGTPAASITTAIERERVITR